MLREFKFSILDNAQTYYPGVEDDAILLQGVIDCAIVEDDGITVIDFKTDTVTQENIELKTAQYTIQVQTYAKALSRIYEKPIRAAYIYFFGTDKLVPVDCI